MSSADEDTYSRLFNLKTVERIFYVCHHQKISTSTVSSGKPKIAPSFNYLSVGKCHFPDVIKTIEEVILSLQWSEILDTYANSSLHSLASKEDEETLAKKRCVEFFYRLSVKLRPKFLIKFRQVRLIALLLLYPI